MTTLSDRRDLTDSEQATLARSREELMTGRSLLLHAQSHRSRRGYMPPMSRRSWAHAVRTLADMAASSDRMAQVAVGLVGHLNLYGDDAQACAALYGHAAQVMATPYGDVIGRAGPEAGRFVDHQYEWTLYDRVAVHYWLELATRGMTASASGVGWCLAEIAREVGFRPTREMEAKGR